MNPMLPKGKVAPQNIIHIREAVELFGNRYWICGRMLYGCEYQSGLDEIKRWNVCGGVYASNENPISLRQIVFLPWAIPMPHITAEGSTEIEFVVQVATDIAEIIDKCRGGNPHAIYKAELRYTAILDRRIGRVLKQVHIGGVYGTDVRQEYILRLHAMPLLYAEPDAVGRQMPAMALIAQSPHENVSRARPYKKAKKQASDKNILQAGIVR